MKYLLQITLIITCLVGCYKKPDFDLMTNKFSENIEEFEKLRKLIQEDIEDRECFEIGNESIGRYSEFDGLWSTGQDYKTKVSIDVVLENENLSKSRYQTYKMLLDKIGAQEISYCKELNGGWTRVIMNTSGIGVSGSLTSIEVYKDKSIPKTDIQESYSTIIIPLINGWHINHDET